MTALYTWAQAHPYLVAAIATVIIKAILQHVTPHSNDATGWRKWLLVALDLVSFWHSKGSTQKGLKLPGSTSPVQPGRLVK